MYNRDGGLDASLGGTMVTKAQAALAHHTLKSLNVAQIGHGSDVIQLFCVDRGTNVHASTLVYLGDNFIPQSVRSVATKPLTDQPSSITTYLVLEEEHFQISLHYEGDFTRLELENFFYLTNEFEELAYHWRRIFDEKDRQDLIHIPIKNQ